MSFQNKNITILYGSQTGNAQDLAERIWRESSRFYFQTKVQALDDYNVAGVAQENCLICVCSTTGQGEEPENMKKFWKSLLRKSLPQDLLNGIRFAVLGLGDSSYVKFNFVAKRLHKRLCNLGGESIIPLGLGDDQHDLGYDAVADPWINSLWSKLVEFYPLPCNVTPLPINVPIIPRWNVKTNTKLLENYNRINQNHSIYYSTKTCNEFYATVLENTRKTHATHFQDVRLIKLRTSNQEYGPGDLLVLRPKNLNWKIEEFKNVLKENGVNIANDTVVQLIENDQKVSIPNVLKNKLTFDDLCKEYFDLFSLPRRSVFQVLSQLTDSELEKEKCIEFTSAEGQQEMYSYANRPKRNIVEVLQDFPNATKNLTLEMMFEILPCIKPREFSIASSYKAHKNEVHLLVAVVKYKTNLVKERFGLCSNFLAELTTGDEISVWFKPGCFKFPKDLAAPVIMVGPGTGLAPFRNFIYELASDQDAIPENIILFYGCRNKEKDCLVSDDIDKLAKAHKMTLINAYSRDQELKVYVQDKIQENGEFVWNALKKGAFVFVAGNSKNMPQAVRDAFINVCEKYGAMSKADAVRYIEVIEKQGRYQTECWS